MASSIAKNIDKSLSEPKLFQYYYQNEVLNFSFYKEHLEETKQEKSPLEFNCYCRTISPAIMFIPSMCKKVEDLPHFAASLLAIGRCNEIASNSRNEFNSINDWNNGKFKFAIRRFGYIPHRPDHTLMEAAAVYFSPSKKTLCFGIKAEAMICAYWKFKDDPYWGPIVRSIITYAVDMYERHPGSEEYKSARYLFELAFAFNYFVKVNDERKAGIPKASTPLATYRYNDFQEFGTFRIYSGTTCPPQDAGFYMYSMPRTVTDIPYNHPIMFYIPHASAASELSTTYAKEWIPKAAMCVDMNYFLTKFVKMYEYMEQFLSEGVPQQPSYISFDNMQEAEKFAASVDLTKFANLDVRFCLKVKVSESMYKAIIINRPNQIIGNVNVGNTDGSVNAVQQETSEVEKKVELDVTSKVETETKVDEEHVDTKSSDEKSVDTKSSDEKCAHDKEVELEDVVSEITKSSKKTESSNTKSKKEKNNQKPSPKPSPKAKAKSQPKKAATDKDWDDPSWD